MRDTRSPWSPRIGGFLAAEALSAIGSFATMIAIWAYAAYRYHASPGQIALYGVAFSAPGVVLGPLAGVVVDRAGPRATLIGAKVLGIAASLALLSAHSFAALTLLSALHGVGAAFARPAIQSLPPRMVDDAYLARTNALLGLSEQLSIVLGPVFAGVAIGLFGFKGAFVFDAATYALGIVALPLVHLTSVARVATHEHPWRDAAAGWRVVADTPLVRRVVTANFTLHLLYGTSMLAEPLYVRDVLHRSPSVFASLQTAFGVFVIVAGLIAARAGERMARFGWITAGVLGSGVAAAIYLGTTSVVIAFAGVTVWGFFTGFVGGPAVTLLQRSTPESVHGRVMAADLLASNLALFLGLGAGGVLIGAVGLRPWIFTLGTLVVVAGTALTLSDRAETRTARAARPAQPSADPLPAARRAPH
ncbi:MAG TPA: MFS transporter [Acidimicrobiales bacterium]|nr:MFS transporter [Acidimicrobiales bacterium]